MVNVSSVPLTVEIALFNITNKGLEKSLRYQLDGYY